MAFSVPEIEGPQTLVFIESLSKGDVRLGQVRVVSSFCVEAPQLLYLVAPTNRRSFF